MNTWLLFGILTVDNFLFRFHRVALRHQELPEEDREAIQALLDDHTDKARTQRVALKAAISAWSGRTVSIILQSLINKCRNIGIFDGLF